MKVNGPDGRTMATVKVGDKGQIVIPRDIRKMFDIEPGDTLLMLADKKQGIAIVSNEAYTAFASAIFQAQKPEPEED